MRVRVPEAHADRHVILMEADDLHPLTENKNHEVFIVGYPDEENIYEVGDTPGVRAKIASGELVEVGRMQAAERETQAGTRAAEKRS